jgi:sigma-B regulation protein RsbU (phosphoserine phosphatase)
MPRVAVAAAVMFVLRALMRDTTFYRASAFGDVFGFITFLLVAATAGYYGFKGLRWLKRKLLWRVRRRLIITYLFVGLTPIVLLVGLGFIFGFGMALNMMANSVMLEVSGTEKQVRANADALADALAKLPPNADARTLQTWLDERNALLQASLPGARVAVWRGVDERSAGALGFDTRAQFTSAPVDARTAPLGQEPTPLDAPLPAWLREHDEWAGFAFEQPADEAERYAASSLRAVVRHKANGQAFVVLLSVPVNRALVERWRENTGVRVRPAFERFDLHGNSGPPPTARRMDEQAERAQPERGVEGQAASASDDKQAGAAGDERPRVGYRRAPNDQLGDPWNNEQHALVVMAVTDWSSGAVERHAAFRFPSTVTAARRQVLERGHLGQELRLSLVLAVFGGIFFTLELLALVAAGWMTRAVTGMVHRLYRATEFIKRGDFSHRVRARSHDQLGELALAYNDMAANIEVLLQERVERERLEREVEIAAEVQAQLFPRRVPQLASAEIAAECRAARGVAGDYYDYVEIAPGFIAIALGDVSGKGLSASLVMSNLQASLRAQAAILVERLRAASRAVAATVGVAAPEAEPPCGVTGVDRSCAVEEIVANINAQLCQSTDANRFVTLFLALYDDRARTLRYTNAGHNAPVLVRADGRAERLDVGGTVVGAFDFARYEEAVVTLAPGDLLLVFSDGLSEAQNATGEEYGEERLLQFAVRHRNLSAGEVRYALFTEIDHWSGGQERGDDQTVVLVKAH